MTDGKKQGEPSRVVCLPNRAASVNWRVFSQKCPTQFFNMPVFKESVAVIDLTHVHEPMLACHFATLTPNTHMPMLGVTCQEPTLFSQTSFILVQHTLSAISCAVPSSLGETSLALLAGLMQEPFDGVCSVFQHFVRGQEVAGIMHLSLGVHVYFGSTTVFGILAIPEYGRRLHW